MGTGDGKINIIYDRKDHNKMKYDPKALNKARIIAAEIEDYYPLSINRIYVLHCNWFFKFLWTLVRPFLSKNVSKTIKMVKPKKLVKFFDLENLHVEYGGYSDYDYT